jgi:L-alanine-DL-glutamate epimerase-like enolase superfamily enzyme
MSPRNAVRLEARELSIPFRVSFRHAAAERRATQSVWVTARSAEGLRGDGEGCPREYVTGEGIATALAFIARGQAAWAGIPDPMALHERVETQRAEIDANPAAWCAVELALLDLFGKRAARPLEALLGIAAAASRFRYTAVLGDEPPEAFRAQLAAYVEAGFLDFKIKLAGDGARDRAKVAALGAADIEPSRVRADANNLWHDADAAIAHLRSLDYPFAALEEPLRAGDIPGMRRVSRAVGTTIVLDESATRVEQLGSLQEDPARWWVNVRVSKMGGVMRSIAFARAAAARGIGLVVGAHVGETSLLTRAALAVVSAIPGGVVAQEGAFGTRLLAHDIVEAPLEFGARGVLEAGAVLGAPGLGLS